MSLALTDCFWLRFSSENGTVPVCVAVPESSSPITYGIATAALYQGSPAASVPLGAGGLKAMFGGVKSSDTGSCWCASCEPSSYTAQNDSTLVRSCVIATSTDADGPV